MSMITKKNLNIFLLPVTVFMLTACTTAPKTPATKNQPAAQEIPKPSSEPAITKSLILRNSGITKLPAYVLDMTNLEELDISNNKLTGALPAEIRKLQNLRILDASNNQMTGVPAEIGQLSKLEQLDLSYNQLTGLPNELGNLKNLKTLILTGNTYSEQDLAGIRAKLPQTNFVL